MKKIKKKKARALPKHAWAESEGAGSPSPGKTGLRHTENFREATGPHVGALLGG